jgi:AraC-like DNA-binding protein
MKIQVRHPSPALRPYIKAFWAMEGSVPEGVQYDQVIVPHGLPELTFFFGDKPEAKGKSFEITDSGMLTGQKASFHHLRVYGRQSLFSVILQPWTPRMLFDFPQAEIFNQSLPLGVLLELKKYHLKEKLFDRKRFIEKQNTLEFFVMKKLKEKNLDLKVKRMAHIVDFLSRSGGRVGLDRLVKEACLSRRQFERQFLEVIGLSPKQFQKVIRFQAAIFQKQRNPGIGLTSLAYDCGYYDQSHMIRDFQLLSGMSPGVFFAGCPPYSDYYS